LASSPAANRGRGPAGLPSTPGRAAFFKVEDGEIAMQLTAQQLEQFAKRATCSYPTASPSGK